MDPFGQRTSSPNDDIPVRVAGEGVPGVGERQARNVLRFVPALENTHPLVQSAILIHHPEADVGFAASDDAVPLQRVEFRCDHRIHGALRRGKRPLFEMFRRNGGAAREAYLILRDFRAPIPLLPVPHSDSVVGRFVYCTEERPAVSLREGNAADGFLEFVHANHGYRVEADRVPDADVRLKKDKTVRTATPRKMRSQERSLSALTLASLLSWPAHCPVATIILFGCTARHLTSSVCPR